MAGKVIGGAVAVIGAGTMGAGIAQVAATAHHKVFLFDAFEGAAEKGKAGIEKILSRQVEKGRMDEGRKGEILDNITVAKTLEDCAGAVLAIEAIVERLDVKQDVFGKLEDILGEEAILATNTSSISVTAIGAGLKRPERLVGMHFFNPAPLMALVEVISGLATDKEVAQDVFLTAASWGKNPVHAKSTPGFIVNRVARPYYAEALRVLEEGGADIATIDTVLKEAGGFRMGPFELMDLIGHDVNYAVTSSVFDAYYQDARFLPSLTQKELVDGGYLGRKSGRGFYDYAENAEKPQALTVADAPKVSKVQVLGSVGYLKPLVDRAIASGLEVIVEEAEHPAMIIIEDQCTLALTDGRMATVRAVEDSIDDLVLFDIALDYGKASRTAIVKADQAADDALVAAAAFFQAMGIAVSNIDDVPGMIVARTVAMLANEGIDAVHQGVCEPSAVDIAMMKGVNYPRGPISWATQIGLGTILEITDNLANTYGIDRYRASPLLLRKVAGGTKFS